jgi:hypothetical protein
MTGTSLVLLAMYSTVNVVGPAGAHLSPQQLPLLLATLMAAGALTLLGMFIVAGSPPKRVVPKGAVLPKARRHLAGPGERRR